jgi:hypothetical protein
MDHADSGPTTASLVATRHQLHGIAECLLAGPEYEATGAIALRVTPGGLGTTAGPERRLDGSGGSEGARGRVVPRSC